MLKRVLRTIRHPSFYLSIVAVLLIVNIRRGPDFEFYLDWSRAAISGDIFRIRSPVESPLGVPLTQWCAGPGLAPATLVGLCDQVNRRATQPSTGNAFYYFLPYPEDFYGVYLTSALFSLAFWYSFAKLLIILSDGSQPRTLFALATAFLGTHVGYYSLACGSELLSLVPIAILAVELARPMRNRLAGTILVGSCAGALVMFRPYLALYALPTLYVTMIRTWQEPRFSRRFAGILLMTMPFVLSCAQVALANFWMTGNWTRSPYVFGDAHFSSFDFHQLEILSVLFHPLHGLFIYHPLYFIGLVAAALLTLLAPSRKEKLVWLGMISITAVHLLIQSAWYQWWLATTVTFGMRGMSAAGIPAVAAIVRLLTVAPTLEVGSVFKSRHFMTLILATTVASLWSWLLLIKGPTDYFSYAALLADQWEALINTAYSSRLITIGFAIVISAIALGNTFSDKQESFGEDESHGSERSGNFMFIICGVLMASLSLEYLLNGWIANRWMIIQYGLLVIWFLVFCLLCRLSERMKWSPTALPRTVCVATTMLVALMLSWFVYLAIPTQQYIASGTLPTRAFRWKATFFVTEAQNGYRKLLRISGHDDDKVKNLEQFLEPYGPIEREHSMQRSALPDSFVAPTE